MRLMASLRLMRKWLFPRDSKVEGAGDGRFTQRTYPEFCFETWWNNAALTLLDRCVWRRQWRWHAGTHLQICSASCDASEKTRRSVVAADSWNHACAPACQHAHRAAWQKSKFFVMRRRACTHKGGEEDCGPLSSSHVSRTQRERRAWARKRLVAARWGWACEEGRPAAAREMHIEGLVVPLSRGH